MVPKVPNRFNNQRKANHETSLQILMPKKISKHISATKSKLLTTKCA